MDKNNARRVIRHFGIIKVIVGDCPICGDNWSSKINWSDPTCEKALAHVMKHTDKERKEANCTFKRRMGD